MVYLWWLIGFLFLIMIFIQTGYKHIFLSILLCRTLEIMLFLVVFIFNFGSYSLKRLVAKNSN
ncbi:hypothetical protein FBFR_02605 [Flavobacterium fryxellicola]|uniref:Uncharacterized protein n=1 Tax=Flavobacterium fryxellicola TaxID=249352 RepID=A0A167ZGI2_9FLAO|nr:hypothetical protein FBFR_02605 [Flavobacterium fryxellicola]